MTQSRNGSQEQDKNIVAIIEDDAALSPRSRKGPSSSPPIETNSRFVKNSSLLALNEADSIIRKHSQDEAETIQAAVDSPLSYASTSVSTPQLTPTTSPLTGQSSSPAISSPLTGQSNSPTTSSPFPVLSNSPATPNLSPDISSISIVLPSLLAPLSPSPHITMPKDEDAIIAGAKETEILSVHSIDNLTTTIGETSNFNITFTGDQKVLVRELVDHIWEENLEILSLARHNRPVGIYYPHGINKTVMATGRAVRNREEFFRPENVSFLTQYGPDANFKVPSLQELNPKVEDTAENFDFNNALIFIPICYTARHVLKANDFFEVMKYFVFEKNCDILVYLGRDGGKAENEVKRSEWLKENMPYFEQIEKMKTEFSKQSKTSIKMTSRSKFIHTPEYLYAEYYFARYLASKTAILKSISSDVMERLTQKKFLSAVTKSVNIKQKSTLTAPSTPQLMPSSPSMPMLFQRPHSFPTSPFQPSQSPGSPPTIDIYQQMLMQETIVEVINSDRPEDVKKLAVTTRKLFPEVQNTSDNLFDDIGKSSGLRVGMIFSSEDDDGEDEKKTPIETVSHIFPRLKR